MFFEACKSVIIFRYLQINPILMLQTRLCGDNRHRCSFVITSQQHEPVYVNTAILQGPLHVLQCHGWRSTRSLPRACFLCANTRFSRQGQAATFVYMTKQQAVKSQILHSCLTPNSAFLLMTGLSQCYDCKQFIYFEGPLGR